MKIQTICFTLLISLFSESIAMDHTEFIRKHLGAELKKDSEKFLEVIDNIIDIVNENNLDKLKSHVYKSPTAVKTTPPPLIDYKKNFLICSKTLNDFPRYNMSFIQLHSDNRPAIKSFLKSLKATESSETPKLPKPIVNMILNRTEFLMNTDMVRFVMCSINPNPEANESNSYPTVIDYPAVTAFLNSLKIRKLPKLPNPIVNMILNQSEFLINMDKPSLIGRRIISYIDVNTNYLEFSSDTKAGICFSTLGKDIKNCYSINFDVIGIEDNILSKGTTMPSSWISNITSRTFTETINRLKHQQN